LFYMQEGIPLSDSFDKCAEYGIEPCLITAEMELRMNGVDSDKAKSLVREGLRDMQNRHSWKIERFKA